MVAFLLIILGVFLVLLEALGAHLLGTVNQGWLGVAVAFLGLALGGYWPGARRLP